MTKRTGVRLRAILARWLDGTTMERFLDPVLADLQCEYENAVRAGRLWHSRRIWIAGHIALCRVLVWHGVTRGVGTLIAAGDERRALNRTMAAGMLFTAAATAIFVAMPLSGVPEGHPHASRLALLLIPQALALVLPFSLMCGILWGLGRTPATRRLSALVLLLAAMSSIGLFVMLAWAVPASNQAFRAAVFEAVAPEGTVVAHPPRKGANELTLTELRQIMEPPADPRAFVSADARRFALASSDSHRNIARQYQWRLAFVWTPLVLAFFALAVTGRPERSRWWAGTAGVAAIAGYVFLGLSLARIGDDSLPAAVAVWIPNAAFLFVSVVVISRRTLRAA